MLGPCYILGSTEPIDGVSARSRTLIFVRGKANPVPIFYQGPVYQPSETDRTSNSPRQTAAGRGGESLKKNTSSAGVCRGPCLKWVIRNLGIGRNLFTRLIAQLGKFEAEQHSGISQQNLAVMRSVLEQLYDRLSS